MSGTRSVVIHGHFYQPPRENPWTHLVDPEPGAAPDHDWNARITRECYRPLAAIPLGRGDEPDPPKINAYQFVSFDVGPTLLEWMDQQAPDVVETLVRADRASRARLGHGNAIAAPYHHVILPLSSRRDKRTEVRWGVVDFRHRFGRDPEGMWLPETAVDQESLDVLAGEGIAFTILAPHQVKSAPPNGLPGRYRTASGRDIAILVYDGPLSHAVAFGPALSDSAAWARQLLAGRDRRVVGIATDGETYGHHHKFGDLALGALLHRLAPRREVRIENFASVLARRRPAHDVEIVAPSSWSCSHGVERWRSNCGCRLTPKTQQRWRAPLRSAIEWLVGEVHAIYERETGRLVGDPWRLRDDSSPASFRPTGAPAQRPADVPAERRADAELRRLVEMEHDALRALTSCGWFFDDFAGLEGRQVLRYSARAIELSGSDAPRLERGFLQRLAPAKSNDRAVGTARDFYLALIKRERAA